MAAPLCECHNEPMFWNKDSRRRIGGYWRCFIRKRELDKVYKDRHQAQIKDYAKSYGAQYAGRRRKRYREDSLFWLKERIRINRQRRLRRIAQDELSHS